MDYLDVAVLHTATHCNTLQHPATHCNTLQHTATHCDTLQHTATHCDTLQHTHCSAPHRRGHLNGLPERYLIAHCNTLQRTTTHCNALQHIATHCSTLQYTHCNIHTATHPTEGVSWVVARMLPQCPLQCTATHCIIHTATHLIEWIAWMLPYCRLQHTAHTATHCNTLQHTATYTLQHTS